MRWIFVLTLSATPVAAQQAFSTSMAECAALMDYSLDHVNRPDRVAFIEHIRDTWVDAAETQAAAEGDATPAATVDAARQAKYVEWSARGMMGVLSQDFRDWSDYCGSFAEAQGIDLKPD